MKIVILNSSVDHPINQDLREFYNQLRSDHDIKILRSFREASGGDILFLISCNEIVPTEVLKSYKHSFVLHASNLPKGRGWSPHIWEIINGSSELTLSMIEAAPEVDTGAIYLKKNIKISKTALWDEINKKLFSEEIKLMKYAVQNIGNMSLTPQESGETYYKKRTVNDSQLDISKSIMSQFNLIRVCDPNRYPAFFEINGEKFKLTIEKF